MVFLTSCLLLSCMGTTLYGQNLLGNPGFESGVLAPWTAGNGNTVNIIGDAPEGEFAAQGNIEQIIDLVAGQAYVWTAQVKCLSGCDKNMWIGRKDLAPDGAVVNFNFKDFSEWGEAKVEFVAENSGPHRFWVWGQGEPLSYVSDNHVLLTAQEYGIQNSLLANPSFETGELAPWTEGNGNTVNIIEDGADGNFAAQGNIEQIIDLVAGQAYVWTAQVKCLSGCDKNMWIGRKDLAPDGAVVNFNFKDFSEWGEAKVEFVAENSGPHRFWVWGQGEPLSYVSDAHILLEVDEIAEPEPEPEPEGEGFGDNLLINPSFETGALDPWTAGNDNIVNLISDATDGEVAAQGNIEQIVNLEAGQSYIWTADVKCLGACDNGMFIGVRDLVAGELVKNFNFKEFGEYGEAKIIFTANSTGEHRFFVFGVGDADYVSDNHVLQKSNVSGTDEPGVEMGPIGDNLLINPGFETGVLDPWIQEGVVVGEGAQEGTYAAIGNIEQIVNLEAGESYVWTAQVKCLGGCDKNMWIGIKDLVADALVTNFRFSDFSEYGEAKIEFTATSTGEHRFWVWGVNETEYISDNHVLKKIGVIQPVEMGPVGDNLIINPSFETGVLDPWIAGNGNTVNLIDGAQEGNLAAQGNVEQIVNLEEGVSYVWTTQVKCLAGCDMNMWVGIRDLVGEALVTNFRFSDFSEYTEVKIEFTAVSTGEHRFWVWGVDGTDYVSDNHVLRRIGVIEGETTSTYEIGVEADKIKILNNQEGLMVSLLDPAIKNAHVYVHDFAARRVYESALNGQMLVSKSHFKATGLYIISVRAGNGMKTQKVFIKAD